MKSCKICKTVLNKTMKANCCEEKPIFKIRIFNLDFKILKVCFEKNQTVFFEETTHNFHIFWSFLEHCKASIGEGKQKRKSADPGEVENRVGKHR